LWATPLPLNNIMKVAAITTKATSNPKLFSTRFTIEFSSRISILASKPPFDILLSDMFSFSVCEIANGSARLLGCVVVVERALRMNARVRAKRRESMSRLNSPFDEAINDPGFSFGLPAPILGLTRDSGNSRNSPQTFADAAAIMAACRLTLTGSNWWQSRKLDQESLPACERFVVYVAAEPPQPVSRGIAARFGRTSFTYRSGQL
jgi:hypothetical protein